MRRNSETINSPLLSIIIPARNDGGSPERLLSDLSPVIRAMNITTEVILVDDSDFPCVVPNEKLNVDFELKVFHRINQRGFGSAIRYGLRKASGSYVLFIMGDYCENPNDVPRLAEKISEGFDLIIGSRFIPGGSLAGYGRLKFVANRAFSLLTGLLLHVNVKDVTNSFKIVRKSLIENMDFRSSGFEISPEITLRCIRKGVSICEVPTSWTQRKEGSSKFHLEQVWHQYLGMLALVILSNEK